jgi:hypothetical protein
MYGDDKLNGVVEQALQANQSIAGGRKVTVVDWDTINAHHAQWDARWNRQIER